MLNTFWFFFTLKCSTYYGTKKGCLLNLTHAGFLRDGCAPVWSGAAHKSPAVPRRKSVLHQLLWEPGLGWASLSSFFFLSFFLWLKKKYNLQPTQIICFVNNTHSLALREKPPGILGTHSMMWPATCLGRYPLGSFFRHGAPPDPARTSGPHGFAGPGPQHAT